MKVEFNVYTVDYQPIELVEVRFISSGAPTSRYTDSNGYVDINIPRRDDIEVILSKSGLRTKRLILNLLTGENRTLTIYMEDVEEQASEPSGEGEQDSQASLGRDGQTEATQIPSNSEIIEAPAVQEQPRGGQEGGNAQPSESTSPVGVALVFDPPSNVRKTPNGEIICSVREKRAVDIYGLVDSWYKTDVCGSMGVIHSSQISFQE
jgi:hypothetical protein